MTAVPAAQLAIRQQAIEDSGWGRPFIVFQPRNLAFWTYLLVFAIGVMVIWQSYGSSADAFQDAMILAIVVFAILTFVLGWVLNRLDRFQSVPTGLRLAAFGWGGVAAIGGIALYGNSALLALWNKGQGQVFGEHWGAALTAPFVEEIGKGCGILLLIALAPRLIRSPFDGFIVGGFIGLGFQIVEDVTYGVSSAASAFGANQIVNGGRTILVRTVTGIPSHWMFSAIFCAGVIWLIGRPDSPRRPGLGIALILLAMLFHGLWDGLSGFGSINSTLGTVLPFVLTVLIIAAFVLVYKATVKTERNWMREILQPEVSLGLLTDAEVGALAGSRKQRRTYVKAAHGYRDRRAARHILEAGSDLGLQLAKDRGMDTAAVVQARNELSRIRPTASRTPIPVTTTIGRP